MKLCIFYDRVRAEEKMLYEAARKLGVETLMYDSKDFYASAVDSSLLEPVGGVDVVVQRCVSHYRALHSTMLLEHKGLPVVNSYRCIDLCGNKLMTTLLLSQASVPTPKTYVAFTKEAALRALDEVGYPAVLKPVLGSWGRLLSLIRDPREAEAIIERREHLPPIYQVYYVQEYVKRPPRDIRSFVIDGEVVAAIYRYSAPGEWRTNTALGGRAVNCPVTPELEEVSLKAAKVVEGFFLGVDLMEGPSGLLVHEVNAVVEFRNSVPATGVNIPGLAIQHIVKAFKR
ncbi:MAG: lysine biosynthesis protein LysX [Candidatus Nezhaarchaeota archaeon]|nr:lysine biosynthesis protein LysX [Candidatus Nezhaarchaeota archaeon]